MEMDLACLPTMPPTAFRAAYEALLAGEHPWDTGDGVRSQRVSEKANAAPRAQYLSDILSMPVAVSYTHLTLPTIYSV